jgi:hypothetical protein
MYKSFGSWKCSIEELLGQINFQNKLADLRLLAIIWSVAFTCVTLYDIIGPLLVRSSQSCRRGASVDFYIRNILNTLARFHPFVHAVLDI